jgi:hypothetical protein
MRLNEDYRRKNVFREYFKSYPGKILVDDISTGIYLYAFLNSQFLHFISYGVFGDFQYPGYFGLIPVAFH